MIEILHQLLQIESYNMKGKEVCAQYIKKILIEMGYKVKVYTSYGAPIIEATIGNDNKHDILIYSHYDVKPAGDINKWNSKPFVPYYYDKRIYARGSGDAKGQIYIALMGILKYIREEHKNKVGITLILEGDEESGSTHLREFVDRNLRGRNYSLCLMLDSHWFFDNPVISSGTRGQLDVRLIFDETDMTSDLHAGNYGGIYEGAVGYMITKISKLLESDIIDEFKNCNPQNKFKTFGDSVSVSYIHGGDNCRSLIPKSCTVKLDFRFTIKQNVECLIDKIKLYCCKNCINMEILQKEYAAYSVPKNSHIEMLSKAIELSTAKKPLVENYIGAYLPMKRLEGINAPIYIVSLAQYDEHNHAPNENISILHINMGIEFIYNFLKFFSDSNGIK